MKEVFISDYFRLSNELEDFGVLNAIITKDSNFFINILRLKETKIPHFNNSYEKINKYFSNIMLLLKESKAKGDVFYKTALKSFSFSGVNGINIGFSKSGRDAGFGKKLSKKVIDDAFDIVKSGSSQPEIFQLISLFEEHIAADRLSDMFATIIYDDILDYTKWINSKLGINKDNYPDMVFHNGIAINKYKNSELLYLPTDILHELPIARCWDDIDRVIHENNAIRKEVNGIVMDNWAKMATSEKKEYLKKHIFCNVESCNRVIEEYRSQTINSFNPNLNLEYCSFNVFRMMKNSGVFNSLIHSNSNSTTSMKATMDILNSFKDYVENNKGWYFIQSFDSKKREKFVQNIIHFSCKEYEEKHDIDISFESDGGNGPVDMKVSRGKDKTVIEVKLSTNSKYLHGFTKQIEDYAKSEKTNQRVFVYIIMDGTYARDKKILDEYNKRRANGLNPPLLYVIDSRKRKSASLN